MTFLARFRLARPGSLAAAAAGRDRLMGPLLLLSAALLAAGLSLPAVSVRGLFLGRDYSLAGAVFAFAASGDWFLFAVTFAFTVAFPVAKVALCLWLWYRAPAGPGVAARLAGRLAALSKWSMLDVFVIALMVLVVDGRLLSSADVQAGAVVFTAAVVLSMIAARGVSLRAEAAAPAATPGKEQA